MTSRDTLAAALMRLRKDRGLSQAGLAKALGVSERQVKRWEKGAMPQKQSRDKLIAMGVDAKLFRDPEEMKKTAARLREIEAEIARIWKSLE